jgi:hypothetical protein
MADHQGELEMELEDEFHEGELEGEDEAGLEGEGWLGEGEGEFEAELEDESEDEFEGEAGLEGEGWLGASLLVFVTKTEQTLARGFCANQNSAFTNFATLSAVVSLSGLGTVPARSPLWPAVLRS